MIVLHSSCSPFQTISSSLATPVTALASNWLQSNPTVPHIWTRAMQLLLSFSLCLSEWRNRIPRVTHSGPTHKQLRSSQSPLRSLWPIMNEKPMCISLWDAYCVTQALWNRTLVSEKLIITIRFCWLNWFFIIFFYLLSLTIASWIISSKLLPIQVKSLRIQL